jgi:hypothetical protein
MVIGPSVAVRDFAHKAKPDATGFCCPGEKKRLASVLPSVQCPHMTALQKHLKTERGAASALARTLGVTPCRISRWAASHVPAARVADVARATGIPAAELRPDLAEAFRGART